MGSEAALPLDSVMFKHIHGATKLLQGNGTSYLSVTLAQGTNFREIIRVSAVATVNIVPSGSGVTIDGLTMPDGAFVLLPLQTVVADRGVYTTSSGTWSRIYSVDEVVQILVHSTGGTVNGGKFFGTINGTAWKRLVDEDELGAHAATYATTSVAGHVKVDGATIAIASGVISTPDDKSTQRIRISNGGSLVGTRPGVNFVAGTGISLTVADDTTNNRLNVTITSSSITGGGTSGAIPRWTGSGALGDSRLLQGGSNAVVELPWISGDSLPTLRVGSNSVSNSKTAIAAYSGNGTGIYAEVNYGGNAVLGYNGVNGTYGYLGTTTVGVRGDATGASYIGVEGSTDTGVGVYGIATGAGIGVKGTSSGAQAGYFINTASSNATATLQADTNGSGAAGAFNQTGSGGALRAQISNASSTNYAFTAVTDGSGTAIVVGCGTGTSSATSYNLLVGFAGATRVVRINNAGKGFFNGGTQSSGADFAEMVDVEGAAEDYAPGEVVIFSTSTDRAVKKSSGASADKIAGVISTFPGFIATKEGLDSTALDSMVAVAMVGIVPVKVCNEGGPIFRGDQLITSSIPGVAKKAGPSPDLATVIGRAWAPFSGVSGSIEAKLTLS